MIDEFRLFELPPCPDWFHKELEAIETVNGRPFFRCVDGQRETAFRNGKMDVKYLLQSDNQPCYIKTPHYQYRRKQTNGEYKIYDSHEAAKADKEKGLFSLIEWTCRYSVRAVGRPCWVIEAYVSPEETNFTSWQSIRYQYYQMANGLMEKVDVLGEYPKDGRYIFCVDVIDKEGNPISPHRGLIEELKRRKWEAEHDKRSLEQSVKDALDAQEKFEKKMSRQIVDNFYQEEGISARRLHHGEISRSIMTVKNL